ncbi:MAG: ABC transporter substrate-binding protein [Candidatus Thorarchaeota archaeon]|jgi:branched-chain amino acid transport system substrate-binding protein
MSLDNKGVLAGIFIIVLLGGVGGGYVIGSMGIVAGTGGLTGEQTIVFLAPLTGALSTYGENSKAAAEYAETQVNAWLTERGEAWSINLVVDDTATEPTQAEQKMRTWHGQGVEIFVGPMSSGECSQLKSYADSNGLLLISPSSTATSLSLPDDSIFRFCPDDYIQGPAIAAMLLEAGITDVVATWRGDAWGDGLKDATEDAYGGTFGAEVRYTPTSTDFPTEAQSLADAVQAALDGGATTDEVAVLAIAFEEVIPYMEDADAHAVLKTVQWFGSDGTCLLSSLADHVTAGPFADTVNYTNTIFTPGASAKYLDVKDYINTTLGRTPDSYCYNTYDIVWNVALAMDLTESTSAAAVKLALPGLVDNYYGASGLFALNANGDRAVADYDLWAVVAGTPAAWSKVGTYSSNLDVIIWE